jgi:hypothetical protein
LRRLGGSRDHEENGTKENTDRKTPTSLPHMLRARRMTKAAKKLPLARFPFTAATYPGRRPRFSFLFTREGIYRLKLRNLDAFLTERNLPPVAERYAVVADGSNACPGQLISKKLRDVPVIFGHLVGAEAVYARRTPSSRNSSAKPATRLSGGAVPGVRPNLDCLPVVFGCGEAPAWLQASVAVLPSAPPLLLSNSSDWAPIVR